MSSDKFMTRFWQVVDEKANSSENTHLDLYIFNHRDGHIFVQAYNAYHMFQQLHNEKKLVIADGDLFAIIQSDFKSYKSEDMLKIVNHMLLNCGYWSDFNYKKIEFMTNYDHSFNKY